MKLLIARPSPFARKVRVALLEKGIPCETLVDLPWNPGARAPSLNPLGKVPALVLDDGRTLYDSKVIIEYLETLGRAPALLPAEPAARVAHRQIEALADGVCDAVVLIVLERARRPELQSADWIARQQAKVEAGFAEAERLLDGGTWFVDDAFGLADVAVGCMLGYAALRLPEFEWQTRHAALAAFSARIEARSSFAATRPEPQPIKTVG
ncbi:MAG TPA: glutathione S-transferase N-terminal domain-containing protein [Burkholderiales bacterium]|nr:glutathione S-transferase N-terminal domain-containing protein [Burkholderiales bacterium]